MGFQIVSEQIAKYRKQKGLTQRELGDAIGISSSAVSQWESGGTPDISLLPILSDILNVSIDQLFGREDYTKSDVTEAFSTYVATIPENKKTEVVFKAFSEVVKKSFGESFSAPIANKLELTNINDQGTLISNFNNGAGFAAVLDNSESIKTVIDDNKEKTCELFKVLSDKDALDLMLFMYQKRAKYCTIEYLSSQTGIAVEKVKTALDAFTSMTLTHKIELDTEKGIINAYIISQVGPVMPFIYAASIVAGPKENGFTLVSDVRK